MGQDQYPIKILIIGPAGELRDKIESKIRKRISSPLLRNACDLNAGRDALLKCTFDAVLLINGESITEQVQLQELKDLVGTSRIIVVGKAVQPDTSIVFDFIPCKRIKSWLLYRTISHAAELKKMHDRVRDINRRYSDLFHSNPLPMWAYNVETLRFFSVNDAARREYGYSRDEYLQMTILDIRPEEDHAVLYKAVQGFKQQEHRSFTGIYRHRKKNGEVISVEVLSNTIYIGGEKFGLVMANNISERLHHLQAIEIRNQQLRDIAFEQCHIVRAPLANLLGILHVARDMDLATRQGRELLERLFDCGSQLDSSIAAIVRKALAGAPKSE